MSPPPFTSYSDTATKQAWLRRHGIRTQHDAEGTEPWLAYKGDLGDLRTCKQLEHEGLLVLGDTELAVIRQIAMNLKIKLWNQ